MAEVPRAGAEDVDAAVARAKAAFPAWRALPPGDRSTRAAAPRGRLGRTRGVALDARGAQRRQADRRRARRDRRWSWRPSATTPRAPERLLGHTIPVAGGVDMTFREPLGVVGLIVPWNFPLTIASWKVAPALAAGNTVVLKPAELTPLTALELERIALEAGLPEGVLNVVAGPGSVCGRRLVEHPDVAKIAFTGSTEVGRGIARDAAGTIKRVTLELGGKSANVIFARRRPREGGRRGAAGGVRQRGPGLLRALADPRRARRRRPVPGGAEGSRGVDARRRPAGRCDADGAVDLGGPARGRGLVRAGRCAGRDPRERAGRPGLLVSTNRAGAGLELRSSRRRGDLRAGGMRDPVRGRGRGDRDRERHDLRPVGVDLDA